MKKTKILERGYHLDRAEVNEEQRTVEVSFSSEHAVRRWFGMEVLGHRPGEANLERLNAGGPVLLHHDTREHHGVVVDGSARVDSDGIGRATVRMADDDDGTRILHRIRDGIIRHVSMRYSIDKARLEREERREDGSVLRHYRATAWTPLEVSFLPIPADPTVGVGRSFPLEDDEMPEKRTKAADDLGFDIEGNEDKRTGATGAPSSEAKREDDERIRLVRDNAHRDASARVAGIMRMMKRYPDNRTVQIEGERAIADPSVTASDFGERVVFEYTSDELGRPRQKPLTHLNLSGRETQRYSLLRVMRALVLSRATGKTLREVAPFEADCSEEIASRLDREANGVFVPFDVQDSGSWSISPQLRALAYEQGFTRAPPMSVGLASTEGAELVGTTHLASQFIEALRPATRVIAAGARVLDGLVGNVDVPKQTGRATFGWIALEDGASADTEVPIGEVTLTPNTVSGSVPITRRLLKQSAPSVEALVRADLVLGAGEALDLAALSGTGASGQPLGIRGQTGVNTSTISVPASPDWDEIVAFETACGADNALRGMGTYLSTWPIYGALKTKSKDAGSGQFIVAGGSTNGYPISPTTQLPTNGILFGDFAQALIGMWGTLDINVDRATKAASGGLVLRAFLDADVAVRHAEAFCKEA